jgi:small subunit ribosomal protein S4
VRDQSKSLEAITGSLAGNDKSFEWLTWDNAEMTGTVMSIPSRELIPENIKEQLIVELYSK